MNLDRLVVRTKLSPLRPFKRTINRPKLIQQLSMALDYRVTVLQAGAGYGKTTALTLLAEQCYPLVWYHLDPEDADPLIFLLYLIHGFQHTFPDLTDAPIALLESWQSSTQPLPVSTVVDTLINELVEIDLEPTLLILDDTHLLNDVPECLEAIHRLIRHAPPALHILLSTRYPLNLDNLVSLRVKSHLLEIGETDLAFGPDEVQALFNLHYDSPLNPRVIQQLLEETEGWPIALQLIQQGLAPDAPIDLTDELSQLADLKDDLFTYLAQEVLDQQPHPIREFLLLSSVLREMTAPACDHLRTSSDSSTLLLHLIEAGLFVVELDEQTVRYHHLFHEFLQHRLPADRKQAAHLKTATYFEEHAEYEESVLHYLAADAFDQAAARIAKLGRQMVLQGRLETLSGWIAALPPETIVEHPTLLTYQGDIARLRSHFDEALRWYEHAADTCRVHGDQQGIAAALRGQARVYLDTVNPAEAEPLLREALRLSDGQEDRETRARLFDLLAENQLNRGQPEEARNLQEQARRLREEAPSEVELDVRVLLRTGRLDEARRRLDQQAAIERRTPVHRPRAHRETLLLLSFILASQGNVERAYQTAIEGTKRGEELASPFVIGVGYMRQGHAWLIGDSTDRYQQAQRCFEHAIEISEELAVDRLKIEAFWGLCRTYGYQGDLARAEDAASHGIAIAERVGDEWIIAMIRMSLGGAYLLTGYKNKALSMLGLAELGFNACGDTFGETAVVLWRCLTWHALDDQLRLKHGMDTLLQRVADYDHPYLMTGRTIPGPPDPRLIVPLLVFARDHCEHTTLATQALREWGLERIEYHPGYQIRVQTLSAFHVWRGNDEITSGDWQRDKARQVFQLLVTYHGTLLDRERIWALLWPDRDASSASRSFKVALNALYTALEPQREAGAPSAYVVREGSLYGLRSEADLWLDYTEFERSIAQGNAEFHHVPTQSIAHYRRAAMLYQGDYLAEFAYEDWSSEKRRQLRQYFLQATDRLTRIYVDIERWQEAIEISQLLLSHEPTWEHAYRVMMISHDQLGNRPQALKTYHRAVEVLMAEIDTPPSPETIVLYESISAAGRVD